MKESQKKARACYFNSVGQENEGLPHTVKDDLPRPRPVSSTVTLHLAKGDILIGAPPAELELRKISGD